MPSLLFVGAHPDDDIFGIGPSVALHAADPDLRLCVVLATDGEAGEIAADSDVRPGDLAAARRREMMDGWTALGRLPDRSEWFGLADGRLVDHPFEDLVERIATVLAEERPDVVVTFGPDGITGHPDHITVWRATTEAVRRLVDQGAAPRRLLYGAIPQSWIERWNVARASYGLDPWSPDLPFHIRGVPDDTIGIDVDTAAVAAQVIAGVRAHKTQWSYRTMSSDTALTDSFQRQHFVVAWPPAPLAGPLSDVFEDL